MRYFKLLTLLLLIIMPGVFSNPAAAAQTLKIGTLSPAGSSWMKKIQKGADEVTQKTEGRVKFKFYPGGVMGDDYTMLRKMRMGQLQGGAVMAGSLVESCPALRLYGLPMIFDSFKEVDYVRDRMDNTINEELEKAGYVSFGMADGGFAFVMSKSPVRTLDDVRNLKVWAPSKNQTAMDAIEGFGITPHSPFHRRRAHLAANRDDRHGHGFAHRRHCPPVAHPDQIHDRTPPGVPVRGICGGQKSL